MLLCSKANGPNTVVISQVAFFCQEGRINNIANSNKQDLFLLVTDYLQNFLSFINI